MMFPSSSCYILLFCATVMCDSAKKSTVYQVDRQKLRELWYVATLRGLIKAKSRETLSKVQEIDAILYKQCELDAKNAVDLARCAVKLFNNRDAEQERERKEALANNPYFPYSTGQTRLRSRVKPNVKKKVKSELWIRITENEKNHVNMDSVLADFQRVADKWNKDQIPPKERQRTEKRLGELAEAYEKVLLKRNKQRWKRAVVKERNKRKVEPLMPLTKQRLDYSKVAAEFFNDLIGSDPPQVQNLDNLRRIQTHFDKAKRIQEYYALMEKENSRLYSQLNLPVYSREPTMQANEDDVLEDVLAIINNFAATQLTSDTKVSILSPRIFSILPEGGSGSPRLLSPNMFSFQNDGVFSLPGLFQIVSSDQHYQKMMLELLLDVSGAGKALQEIASKMQTEMDEINDVHYPLMLEMSRHDHNWMRATRMFSGEQKEQYDRHGFAYLDKKQMELIYSNRKFTAGGSLNMTEIAYMNPDQRSRHLENKIRELAKQEHPSARAKRDIFEEIYGNVSVSYQHDQIAADPPNTTVVHPPEVELDVLHPIAFTNFINGGEVLEAIVLSPRAFIMEIMAPEFMILRALQPEAFVFSLLTPSALVARILSPSAFRAEVLSPRVFYPWVLSPEALLTEVLSPAIFNPRVLSPEVLLIKVLSPSIISPNVGSGEMLGVLVLSPNILSPRIVSEEYFLVEVLSPHILGGPHGKHDSSVISIGGGEHEHEHATGDEGGAAHQGDVHVHRGELEEANAHSDQGTPIENNIRANIDAFRG